MRRSALGLLAVLTALLLLAACANTSAPQPTQQSGLTAPTLLAEHGFSAMSARQIVNRLERTSDKPADLMASVQYDELQLADVDHPRDVVTMPLGGRFHLSVAPYVHRTHDCYFHSLTTCQGELVGRTLDVTITGDDGRVLVDGPVRTYPDGFVAFWLPRDITATLEVDYHGRSATTRISTGSRAPTCLTSVRLTQPG